MCQEDTTAVVQRYLDELDGDSPAEPLVRALLDQAVRRSHLLCAKLLYRSYSRLTQPPLNLQADELLGAVSANSDLYLRRYGSNRGELGISAMVRPSTEKEAQSSLADLSYSCQDGDPGSQSSNRGSSWYRNWISPADCQMRIAPASLSPTTTWSTTTILGFFT
jgi:hypothetical protein